jgi:hypothetical protein
MVAALMSKHIGVDLISDALPFNAVANAIGYAMHRSRSHDAVIRVYHEAGDAGTRILPRNVDAMGAVPEWGEALALVQV